MVEQATELFECSIDDLSSLIEYVRASNDNAKIGLTDSGRLPWGCGDLHEESYEWDFCLKDNEVITIPTGTYWFTSWHQSGGSRVLFDGYARILVTGSISLQESSGINAGGNAYDVLIFHFPELSTGITMAGTVQLSGLIYSPNEKIHLSGQSIVKGGLIADEIVLTGQAQLTRVIDESVPVISMEILGGACIGEGVIAKVAEISDMGSGIDPESVSVSVGGIPQPVFVRYEDGYYKRLSVNVQFEGLQQLGETQQPLSIEAKDRAGNAVSMQVEGILVDLTPPVLEISGALDGSIIDTADVKVWGSISDNLSNTCGVPEVRVNGISVFVGVDGSWFATVPLVQWNGKEFEKEIYENKIVPSVANRNIKIVLLYDTAIHLGSTIDFNRVDVRNTFISTFAMFASSNKYFKNPKYLKFGNKPVVYIYVTRAITGSDANIKSAFNDIISAAIQNGFAGLYIVADHLYWGSIDWNKLKLMQPSAITSFAPVDTSQNVIADPVCSKRPVRKWADKLSNLYLNATYTLPNVFSYPVDLEPGIFVQYDDTGLDTAACSYNRKRVQHYRLCDGSDWSYMIKTAGLNRDKIAEQVTVDDDCSVTTYSPSNYTSIIWTYSYNEWGEGAGSERLNFRQGTWPFGFELQVLDILKGKLP